MTLRQRIRFYQQLGVLMRAGVPIRASMTRLKERISTREVAVLAEKLNAGERIGDAFAAARFTPFECNLVTAGEQSGHLDTIFEHLSEFWSRELQMRQAMIRPLYYPLVILHLAILVWAIVDFVTTGSIPVAVAHFVMRMAIFYAAGIVIYLLVSASWSSESMRRYWLYVPFIGRALKTGYAYRWITALKLEFIAGVTISRAIGDAWRASGYLGSDERAEEGEKAVREGTNLSTLVTKWKQLPRDWIDFIETGEISGALEMTFTKLEEESARAWKIAQQQMEEWIPRISYFFILLVVAFVVGSIMKTAYIDPIVSAENAIDNTSK